MVNNTEKNYEYIKETLRCIDTLKLKSSDIPVLKKAWEHCNKISDEEMKEFLSNIVRCFDHYDVEVDV